MADGYTPAGSSACGDRGPFLVREDEGRLVIAAGTYRRYDLAVEVLGSVDAEAVVAIRGLEPAIDEARHRGRLASGRFEDRLRQAIDHLLEVEIPEAPSRSNSEPGPMPSPTTTLNG